ncbi:MAG: phosphotransferase [Ruminiclostridium sp.]|nr:phosphotransferase [Ruminiclostridium sp.]
MKTMTDNNNLFFFLEGRIDTANAAQTEKDIFDTIDANAGMEISFDANDLEYISSAGLRVLLKVAKTTGKKVRVTNVSRAVYEIFETTGFTELLDVRKAYRRISVDGCEVIGKGFYGTVYRIDPETIVKVYESPESLSMIENEKRLARIALVAGVPTAISYDIVRVGDSYGSVFELLNARTFNDMLIENPGNVDEITKQYAQFLHLVNSQTVPEGKLESAKEKMMGYLDTVAKYLDTDLYGRLKDLIEAVPEQNYVIHGDAQMKNVMLRDGEPMLIDMDTLAAGHPIFDLQSIYVSYFAFDEDEPDNCVKFLGVQPETTKRVWATFIGYYFDTDDEDRIAQLRDKISIAGCIRFLFLIDLTTDHNTELFRLRIKHTTDRLRTLAYKTDTLLFDLP